MSLLCVWTACVGLRGWKLDETNEALKGAVGLSDSRSCDCYSHTIDRTLYISWTLFDSRTQLSSFPQQHFGANQFFSGVLEHSQRAQIRHCFFASSHSDLTHLQRTNDTLHELCKHLAHHSLFWDVLTYRELLQVTCPKLVTMAQRSGQMQLAGERPRAILCSKFCWDFSDVRRLNDRRGILPRQVTGQSSATAKLSAREDPMRFRQDSEQEVMEIVLRSILRSTCFVGQAICLADWLKMRYLMWNRVVLTCFIKNQQSENIRLARQRDSKRH